MVSLWFSYPFYGDAANHLALENAHIGEAGATAVVQPELEASIEVIRHALQRYGISERELTYVVAGRRNAFSGRGPGG